MTRHQPLRPLRTTPRRRPVDCSKAQQRRRLGTGIFAFGRGHEVKARRTRSCEVRLQKLAWGTHGVIRLYLGGLLVLTPCTTCSLVRIHSRRLTRGTRLCEDPKGEFKKQYPDAKVIAVDEAIKKKEKEGLKFDGGTSCCAARMPACITSALPQAWGADPPDTKYGFENDVSIAYKLALQCVSMADSVLDSALVCWSGMRVTHTLANSPFSVTSRGSRTRTSRSSTLLRRQ